MTPQKAAQRMRKLAQQLIDYGPDLGEHESALLDLDANIPGRSWALLLIDDLKRARMHAQRLVQTDD